MNYTLDPSDNVLKILTEDHYYPFGLKHKNYNAGIKDVILEGTLKVAPVPVGEENSYKYKFQGQEWQDELGLGWYSYKWRNYDPAIGRWMNIDPLAEKSRRFSPYVYALNNPVFFIDPDGMQALATYGVDNKGQISKIDDTKYYDKNGKEVDKLIKGTEIKYDKNGEIKNKNIDVSVGVLENKTDLETPISDSKTVTGWRLDFGNNSAEAETVFNFLADNSSYAEFSMVTSGNPETPNTASSSVFTSHTEDAEYFGARAAVNAASGGVLKTHRHSHPYHDASQFSPSDESFMSTTLKRLQNFKENNPSKKYYEPTFYLRKDGENIKR